MESHYYISKNQKVVGPCTLDDLYSYIAYGSVSDHDLVRRDGDTEWTPLNQLEELELDLDNPATSRDIATSRSAVTKRRRVARYRLYDRVPPNLRADVVMKRMVSGFFFPPHLWKAAASVFQDRIYTWKADAKGFLTYWPRWVEILMALLLVANSILWVFCSVCCGARHPRLRIRSRRFFPRGLMTCRIGSAVNKTTRHINRG